LQTLISYFFSQPQLKFQTALFKNALYLFLVIKIVYWLVYYDLYFGEHAIAYAHPQWQGPIKNLAYILYNSTSIWLPLSFILLALLLCVAGIFAHFYFVSDLFLWFLILNLQNKIYSTLTSGDILLNQFLLFNCFFVPGILTSDTWKNTLKIFLHNLNIVAIITQICLVYFISGLAKLADDSWLKGTAILAITQVKHFSMYVTFNSMPYGIGVFLNYLVLGYQLFFPILVWIKPLKKPFLFIGILMHLYIAFVMGVVAFGVIMVISYIFFWPAKQNESGK
jgi:hypothetical protein